MDARRGAERVTREAAMAKLVATESAQKVIDPAVQMASAHARWSKGEELYQRFAPCASTKAPRKCSARSSPATC